MSVGDWLYDRAPSRVRDWLDGRKFQQMVDEQHQQYLRRQAAGTGTALDRWRFEAPENSTKPRNSTVAGDPQRHTPVSVPNLWQQEAERGSKLATSQGTQQPGRKLSL
jgi:hypothetical protein